MHLTRVALALQDQGWRCVLALRDGWTAPDPPPAGLTWCEAPRWGADADDPPAATRSSASLADMLAQIGLASTDWTRRQVARWHAIFATHAPDIVVADYAPGAVLAARGRIPCLAVGNGFSVPPAGLARFPLLHNLAPPLHREEAVLASVNAALTAFGTRPLDRLSDALTGDATCPCTLPLIDPYARWRKEPALGPILPHPVARRDPSADGIFCYLRPGPGGDHSTLLAQSLKNLPGKLTANLPGLGSLERQELARAGVTLVDGMADVTRTIARSRLVVHGGGHGIAATAILAGAPQLILDLDIEKRLLAEDLSRRGIARRLDAERTDPETLRTAILSALEDPVLEHEAERAADEHAGYRRRDPAAEVAAICAGLA